MAYVVRSNYETLNIFAKRLKDIGRRDLHDLLAGKQIMKGVSAVADAVGFGKHPVEGQSMQEYVKELLDYIERGG
jgi:hypothetical protein